MSFVASFSSQNNQNPIEKLAFSKWSSNSFVEFLRSIPLLLSLFIQRDFKLQIEWSTARNRNLQQVYDVRLFTYWNLNKYYFLSR